MTLFIIVSMVVITFGAFFLLRDARSDPDADPRAPKGPSTYR